MRAVSVFADLNYLPSLAALMNSILHFQVQARIKIYDFAGLPHLAKIYLSNYATLVAPPMEAFGDRYRTHWNYRPRLLLNNLDPYELQIDADTLVLSDLESAFQEIEKGSLAAVNEWEYDHAVADSKHRDDRQRELPPDSVFHRILKYPEAHHEGLPIYNAGLLGLNREKHSVVIDLWAQATRDFDRIDGTFFWVDQNKFSLIVKSLLKEGKIHIHELPKHLWMQTWDQHREPRKIVAFQNGPIALYNGCLADRMHFYHYTGDITAPAELAGEGGKYPVRFNAFLSDFGIPEGLTQAQMIDSWNYVWRERHESPAGELPLYFYNLGPVRAPKCLDARWRESLARLIGRLQGIADLHKDSKETWALAWAYDYIDYCGYRGVDLGWMSDALKILLDEPTIQRGDKAISWQGATEVSIDFEPAFADQRKWSEADTPRESAFRANYSEYHQGVFLNIR